MTRPSIALSLSLLLAATVTHAAPSVLEREFRFEPGRFSVVQKQGEPRVEMKGATRQFTPGRPDLPVLGEMVDLPAGVRVTGVEVVSLATAVLNPSIRVPTAIKAKPGLAPTERTEPDAKIYGRAGFPPVSDQVELGYQGWMRGRHVACLAINPVRWDAATGVLERVERMTVRLRLEAYQDPDVVVRERVVPEWEDERPVPVAGVAPAPSGSAEPFKATQIPSVLGSPVAYVIITTDALAAEFQRLADWKTQSGVPAVVRTLTFVRQQYPFGTDDADRLRQFIRDAYARWGTKWILLGGDTDLIPHRNIYTTFFGGENIPCDMYYSCLDGNWNGDADSTYGEGYISLSNPGDASDVLPEVYVGRAPVVNVADVQRFVNKTFQYSRTPVGDYEHQLMFFAEVLFPQYWTQGQATSLDGAELVEEVLPYIDSNPNVRYLRLYENYLDVRWIPGSLQESKAVVLDSLEVGYNMAVHVGHGYRNVMSVGDDTIENADVTALTNGNRLMNVYAIDCTSNAIDFPCIGEAFLNAPNGGAVTNIGSTRFDFPHAGRAFQEEYFRLMYDDSVTAIGEAQTKQKLPFASSSIGDNINRWTSTTLLMLGDPEMHQWIGKPRTLVVTHPSSYALNDSSIAVHVTTGGQPLAGARVTVYKPNEDFRTTTTNASGDATLEFRPGTTGTFYLTVTGFDCRPSQDTLTVGAAGPPALVDLAPTIDDDASGGTSGNGNGQLDAGEVVDLRIPIINRGGTAANAVNGVISTTDGLVTISDSDVGYGNLAASATSIGTTWYRLSLPYTAEDQREIPIRLDLVDNAGRHYVQRLTLTAHAPDPRHFSHTITDLPGDQDGVPEPGETVTMLVKLRNLGTGTGSSVSVKLRNYDGLATVTDSTASFGTMAPGQEVQGDALVYSVGSTAAVLELRISNNYGLLSTQRIDLVRPSTPVSLASVGSQTSITITWARNPATDLMGYNLYRSLSSGGTYTKITTVPTDRTSYYRDEGLAGLTNYYYKVAAVDSSGNESPLSAVSGCSTNPPHHDLFPVEMRRSTPAPVAIDYVYQPGSADIFAGSDIVWAWHADGTAPVDADGSAVSHGDFSTRGAYYAGGVSLGHLGGNGWSVVAPSWDSLRVYVWDINGAVRPGWPFNVGNSVWSGVAIGDLNNDGSSELVFGSNGDRLYALRANGTELIDGDGNPGTPGVFKVLGNFYNYGTPAIADLDGDGNNDIVYAGFEGKLFAWRHDGTSLPNFPVNIGVGTTSSVAIGYLDGPSDTQLDIVVASHNDSLYVFKADGGRHDGFPVGRRFNAGTDKNPSPALADMNNDGFVDIVAASTDGRIYVFDHNGALNSNFVDCRFSALNDGFATQSSPVVADINGDGRPDIVMGDEMGVLTGIGYNGQMLPGFPIQTGGEVRGSAGLCDCDGDGMTEIAVSSWDKKTYFWDYDFPFSPGVTPPWPQFHHDARRTGLMTNSVFLAAPDPTLPGAVVGVQLLRPEPNPARLDTRIQWTVPAIHVGADLDLSVYDLAGRRLATLAAGRATEGRYALSWDLRSDDGSRVGGGVYFLRFRVGTFTTTRKLVVMP